MTFGKERERKKPFRQFSWERRDNFAHFCAYISTCVKVRNDLELEKGTFLGLRQFIQCPYFRCQYQPIFLVAMTQYCTCMQFGEKHFMACAVKIVKNNVRDAAAYTFCNWTLRSLAKE